MPIDRSRYPKDWDEIAFKVKDDADWKCELWFQRMREMLEEFNNQPSSTEVCIDGASYHSDWVYGIECIEFFIEALERRYGGEPSADG